MLRSAKVILSSLLLTSPVVSAGTFSQSLFTDDASSGVDSSLQYTSIVDFHGTGTRTVNGLTFGNTGTTGNFYMLSGATNTFSNNSNAVTGNINGLLSDFAFGGVAGTGTSTL